MSADAGHNYTFGPPARGWPNFGPDGRRLREVGAGHRKIRDDEAASGADDARSRGAVTEESSEAEIVPLRPSCAEVLGADDANRLAELLVAAARAQDLDEDLCPGECSLH